MKRIASIRKQLAADLGYYFLPFASPTTWL